MLWHVVNKTQSILRIAKLTDILNNVLSQLDIWIQRKYSLLYSNKSNVPDYLFGHIRHSQEMVLCPIYED